MKCCWSCCRRANTIYCHIFKAWEHTSLSHRFLVEELGNVTKKGIVFWNKWRAGSLACLHGSLIDRFWQVTVTMRNAFGFAIQQDQIIISWGSMREFPVIKVTFFFLEKTACIFHSLNIRQCVLTVFPDSCFGFLWSKLSQECPPSPGVSPCPSDSVRNQQDNDVFQKVTQLKQAVANFISFIIKNYCHGF